MKTYCNIKRTDVGINNSNTDILLKWKNSEGQNRGGLIRKKFDTFIMSKKKARIGITSEEMKLYRTGKNDPK